ncbi:MAG TPA: DoxX family protein [Candidatus Tectomicrobia bacterium]
MHTIVQRLVGACHQVTAYQWVALLLARLAIGFFFVMSGYNKLFVQDMGHLRDAFIVYGIPWPLLSAWIDALVQFIGGFALMVGLGTRLWSLLIGCAMLVASLVVTIPDVLRTDIPTAAHGLLFWGWFYYRPEPIYITVFLLLIFLGPGKASLDQVIARKLGMDQRQPPMR